MKISKDVPDKDSYLIVYKLAWNNMKEYKDFLK